MSRAIAVGARRRSDEPEMGVAAPVCRGGQCATVNSPRLVPARQVVIGLIAAGALGAGLTLGIGHASRGSSTISIAAAAASPAPPPARPAHHGFGHGGFPGLGGISGGAILGVFTKDTGLTPMQILSGIKGGQTLEQLAGSNAVKVKSDYLAEITTGLDQAVTKGVITKDAEAHLIADARDAIDQLMAAHLDRAGLGGFLPGPGKLPPGFGHDAESGPGAPGA